MNVARIAEESDHYLYVDNWKCTEFWLWFLNAISSFLNTTLTERSDVGMGNVFHVVPSLPLLYAK